MNIDLGGAAAGAAIAISVLDDYMQELYRIGRIPSSVALTRTVGGASFDVTVLLGAPRFEMAKAVGVEPYTRLQITGTLQIRPAGQPNDPPLVAAFETAARLTLVKLPQAQIGLRYDGVDGTPTAPLTSADVDAIFTAPGVATMLSEIRISAAGQLIDGLNDSMPGGGRAVDDWAFELTLMPAATGTVDSVLATVAVLGSAAPGLRESFVPENLGFAIAFNEWLLDLMLGIGADAQEGATVGGAKILEPLVLKMTETAVQVNGKAEREVTIFPNVNVSFAGPMHPFLVRGTTVLGFDMDDVEVEIDQSDVIFYTVFKWFVTVLAGALLFTPFGSLTITGIVLWATAVQAAWNADVKIGNAPNVVRDSLAASLGAGLSRLAENLDDETTVGQLRVDSTPDSMQVASGNMVFFAQVLVRPLSAMLVSAEYSTKLRRFAIFELEGGRRFRAQELARMMATGKITVPGFHQVRSSYLRANPDNVAANNLLRTFRSNRTTEAVLPSTRS